MYVLYGSRRPGTETLIWEDKLKENCEALMQLESERGTTDLRITEVSDEPKTISTIGIPDSTRKALDSLDPQAKAREALFMVVQEIEKEDRMIALKTEVYRTFAKADTAAKKLTMQTGFKHFVKQI